ncbi:hypothetical protein QQF21_03375 [Lelliottia sp. V89_10]|uniref:hypothetical protein n=1 Tax=Lelliottia wanjuensis TaxID=3050585 RepID=UPI00249DC81A|nr:MULTISPECIES: hypothetical protein [unclassified Lelliottia]MDI3361929.1 hypothetical protein [Lelliottia sp. V89_13]MDK9550612.1 hypothetical protein [Lelliottia sp. V89_5]MDK9594652.1 hypothetical protein [Lelliottia sp. V89_10]
MRNGRRRRFYQDLQVNNTGSLSVNQYRWINIWTAILGHFFARFPVFFDPALIVLKSQVEIFPDGAGKVRINVLHFAPLIGIKRGARLIQKALDDFIVSPLPAGLSSEYLALA